MIVLIISICRVYAFPMVAISSITIRVTGVALTAGMEVL